MMKISRYWRRRILRITRGKLPFDWTVADRVIKPRVVFLLLHTRDLSRRVPVLLGWPGVAGVGLLTACAAFYFSTIQPAQEKLATTRQSVLELQDQLKLAEHDSTADQRTPEEQISHFYSLFPQNKDLPQCMEKIFASAQSQGIELEQGEYKMTQDKEGGVVRFQMTFPVKGDYPRIRKYLTSLMADIPTLSLQQVKFKRQKVGDAIVEANINLVLFLLEQKS